MKIRLHEIEFGTSDVAGSRSFYTGVLGMEPKLDKKGLVVFDSGNNNLDFNISKHFHQGIVAISFLSDNLVEIEKRLIEAGIAYVGPSSSHLGMTCIQFNDSNGHIVKVNTPGPESPDWLKV